MGPSTNNCENDWKMMDLKVDATSSTVIATYYSNDPAGNGTPNDTPMPYVLTTAASGTSISFPGPDLETRLVLKDGSIINQSRVANSFVAKWNDGNIVMTFQPNGVVYFPIPQGCSFKHD